MGAVSVTSVWNQYNLIELIIYIHAVGLINSYFQEYYCCCILLHNNLHSLDCMLNYLNQWKNI